MNLILKLFLSALAVFVSAYVIPGVRVESYVTALIVAVVLGVVNMILKPILVILTLPITILTLGLFYFVINAILVLLVASVVPGFFVSGFGAALLFSLVLSVVGWFLNSLTK